MPKKKRDFKEILEDLLILELAKEGVPQRLIQEIVGIDIHRVARIAKHINKIKK